MIIRKVDPATNDWKFGKGLSSYAVDEQAIEENIKTRLLSWVGDCFFDLQAWVDWKSRLDVGQSENLKNELKNVILQSFGVSAIQSFVLNFDTRRRIYNITYSVQTIFGTSFTTEVLQAVGGS